MVLPSCTLNHSKLAGVKVVITAAGTGWRVGGLREKLPDLGEGGELRCQGSAVASKQDGGMWGRYAGPA